MSNTTKITGNFLQIKGLDADWSTPGDLGTDFDKAGLRVKSITFNPSATNDVMIIKESDPNLLTTAGVIANTTTAPEVFHVKCSGDTDQRIKYFGENGRQMRPFIDISDCTLSSATLARVELELV